MQPKWQHRLHLYDKQLRLFNLDVSVVSAALMNEFAHQHAGTGMSADETSPREYLEATLLGLLKSHVPCCLVYQSPQGNMWEHRPLQAQHHIPMSPWNRV